MNKIELILDVSKQARVTQTDAKKVFNAFIETVEKTVAKGKKVTLQGFGTFKVQHRAERTARIISENREIRIPATNLPVFIPSKMFKERVENYKPEPLFLWGKML